MSESSEQPASSPGPSADPSIDPVLRPEHDLLDPDLLRRVYRTTAILVAIIAVVVWEALGFAAMLGLLIGTACNLLMLASLEWTIRRHFSGEMHSTRGMVKISILKLLVVTAVLAVAFFAAMQGWGGISLADRTRALICIPIGFAVPHLVILLKVVGKKVNQALNAPSPRGRN